MFLFDKSRDRSIPCIQASGNVTYLECPVKSKEVRVGPVIFNK